MRRLRPVIHCGVPGQTRRLLNAPPSAGADLDSILQFFPCKALRGRQAASIPAAISERDRFDEPEAGPDMLFCLVTCELFFSDPRAV